jgi:hypothetical protein
VSASLEKWQNHAWLAPQNRNLRFENTLTDEHGDDVKPQKGAHVEVAVTEDPET